MIHNFVTKDDVILTTISRYARAGLVLWFLTDREGDDALSDDSWEKMIEWNLLEEEEVEQLMKVDGNWQSVIWMWIGAVVQKLVKEKHVKNAKIERYLVKRVMSGHGNFDSVTNVGVQLPLPYVHLLGFLVKIHNLVFAAACGLLFSIDYENNTKFGMTFTLLRLIAVPMLYNGILFLGMELRDPFGTDM